MLSLLPPSHHVSSYGTSTSHHPTLQSSYDYTSACNPTTWGSVVPYPSPPMSSSPSATAHYADRGFDPNYAARMRGHPQHAHDMFWAQPAAAYPQPAMYQQMPQQQQHHHHQAGLPMHSRSPRLIPQPAYLPPLPVAEPYPNFHQSEQARSYAPNSIPFYSGSVTGPSIPVTSIASKAAPPKTVRRTKQHVPTACFNCKKAHLSCDIGRPCNRCKQSGKQESCYNVAHKRRGRPRLRDSLGNKIVRNNDTQPGLPGSAVSGGPAERRRSDPLRVLKSNDGQTSSFGGHSAPASAIMMSGQTFGFPQSSFDGRYANLPVAFLDLDLNIVQMNHIFRTVFGLDFDIQGKNVEHFIDAHDKHKLQAIRNGLRQEKDTREPYQLNPLRLAGTGETDKIPMVDTSDVGALVSQGFQERAETFRIQVAGNMVHDIRITIRLARAPQAGTFFVVLILPHVPETGPTFAQPQQPPRLMPPANSSYTYGDNFPMSASTISAGSYGAPTPIGATQRSAATSAPTSPFNYTFAIPQSAQLAQARSSYDPNYYMTQQNQSMYAYPTQSGVTAQAMGAASEPRQFSTYSHDPSPIQMHFAQPQSATQQQMMPGDYQLPPLSAQSGSRPRTAADAQLGVMRQDPYGRPDQHNTYMHDGSQHVNVDPNQGGQDSGKGTRFDLKNLLG